MTPTELAVLHRAAFTRERPWTVPEFAQLLGSRFVHVYSQPGGFALTRTLAGESELLTLAVHPDSRRRGIALGLLHLWLTGIADTTDTAFLEVAADNKGARALYARLGFAAIAQRRGYYARKGSAPADAIIMRRALPLGQVADSTAFPPESS